MAKAPSTEQMSAELREKNRQDFLAQSAVQHPVYHATNSDVQNFDPKLDARTENPDNIAGWFSSDPEFANDFASQRYRYWKTQHRPWEEDPNVPNGVNVMPAHLAMQKPFQASHLIKNLSAPLDLTEAEKVAKALGVKVTDLLSDIPTHVKYKKTGALKEHTPRGFDIIKSRAATNAMKRLGHDSVIAVENGSTVYAPFYPTQIKSAIGNRGTYDRTNPDINKAQGGAVKPTLDQMRQAIAARTTPRFSEGGPEDTAPTKQQKDRWDWIYRTKPAMVKTYGALARSQFNDPGPKRLRNTPAVVQQRITNANEFLDKPTEPWQPPPIEKQAFDRSDIQQALGGFPGIEQSRFPRDVPPRANISHVHEAYLNPVNRALIKKQIARGLPLGGETFYASLYPVKLAAMERGIPAEKFDSWVHSIAPASARNSIMNEMAVGQAIRDAHARGSDLSPESLKADREAFRVKHGVGLPMMPIHETGVANVLKNNINLREHSRANIPTNYKIPTYGAQKAGDFAHSWVGDVHEAAGETLGSQYHPYFKEAGGFGNTEYGAAEKHMLDIANEMGIPGGTAQAGRWFGGGELTGLRSPRGDALDLLEKQVAYTLHHQGIAPTPKAVREYVLSMIDTGRGHLLPWFKKAGMPDLRVVNKAEGGAITQDEMLAHTTLGRKMPNVRNIGADEAPDMKVKQYISPGPGKGNTLPAGGVDFQPEMPGHQLTQAAPAGPGGPAMPGMPGMPPGAPGMPPGGPGPGMPGMPPPLPRNQPGMPTGKPAGLEPPNIPPPKQKPSGSNILSMTPQGQALAALGPMRKMADGGSVEQMKRELAQKKNIRLFHGSHEKNLSAVNDKGTFGGVFGHPSKNAALSHGENVYHTDVPEDKVFKIGHNVPQRKMRDFINAQFPGSKHKEELADHLIHGTSLFKSSIPEEELLKATRSDDIGEADWDMQRRRGLLAKSLGYHAAEMPDEHGTSYLVLPGASLTRHMADGGSVPKKQAPVKQRNVYDLLRKFGRMATSTEDAERALSNGDRVFYGHDMEEDKPTEVRNTGDMRGYTSDQIIILPAKHMADGGPVASRAFQEVEAPKKTTKAYKLFRTHPKHPGKLFPLFVDANEPVEQGKWLAAQAGESAGEKVKSKIGPLAYRPGWHGGDLPIATHIGSKSTSRLKKPDIRPDNHVWAEVEMPNDVDWHSEAQRRGTNAQGRVVPVKAHITDQVPTGGHYRYKTNANMTGNWLIGGSMKVNRVLPDKEVAAINKAAGVADLPRRKMADGGSVKHMAGGSLRDKILQDAGVYGARRFERALDEIPNLQQMYSAKALHSAFTGDNAKAIMTMDPAHFENYATPIIESLTGHKDPTVIKHLGEKFAVPTSEHIKHLATILRKGGFDDVPFLGLDKEEVGLPLMPFIKGHEGRHRSRALTQTGVTKNLVRLLPRAELREPLPRRSQEEYIAALKAELDKNGLVRPEPAGMRQERREPVRLPDIYRGGGGVTLPPSTEQMRQALSARRSNSKA